MKKITFLIFILSFLLFRPYQMQDHGMMYTGDDSAYFAHSTVLVYGQFPSYKKEYFTTPGERPLHSMGTGLMAAPFVFVFSFLDRLFGNSIIQQRTIDNISQSWSAYGFVLSSIFYLWLGCFLLYKSLRRHFNEFETVLSIYLMILCQGIPLFAFRRPFFSHIYEFSIVCILVWWMLLPAKQWPSWIKGWFGPTFLGLLLGVLVLTRLNEAAMALIWPLILFPLIKDHSNKPKIKKLTIAYSVTAITVFLLHVLPEITSHAQAYYQLAQRKLMILEPLSFYFLRIFHILTGPDWGLIYTAPFILVGFIIALTFKYPLRQKVILSLLPLLINIYIIISWKTQAGWYSYRYLFLVAAPLLIFPFTWGLNKSIDSLGKKRVLIYSLFLSLLPLLSMLAFEGNSKGLTQINGMQYFGVSDWGNNTYQQQVWNTLIKHPVDFGIAIFKGGPLYVAFVIKSFINNTGDFLVNLKQYKDFSLVLFLKVLGVWFLPFFLTYLTTIQLNLLSTHKKSSQSTDIG